MVDQNGLKTGQATTILLLLLAFVLNAWPLVLLVAVAQVMGALALPIAPYKLLYQHIVKRFVQPNPQPDNAEPHRFALAVGGAFNIAATIALLMGSSVVGWSLVWIVIALANLNLWAGFCLGCWVYYRLNQLGVPGFNAAPVAGE